MVSVLVMCADGGGSSVCGGGGSGVCDGGGGGVWWW